MPKGVKLTQNVFFYFMVHVYFEVEDNSLGLFLYLDYYHQFAQNGFWGRIVRVILMYSWKITMFSYWFVVNQSLFFTLVEISFVVRLICFVDKWPVWPNSLTSTSHWVINIPNPTRSDPVENMNASTNENSTMFV